MPEPPFDAYPHTLLIAGTTFTRLVDEPGWYVSPYGLKVRYELARDPISLSLLTKLLEDGELPPSLSERLDLGPEVPVESLSVDGIGPGDLWGHAPDRAETPEWRNPATPSESGPESSS